MPLTKNPGARTVSGNHAPSVACAAVSPDCDWEPVWISAFSSFPWTRSRIQRSNCRRVPDGGQGDENDEVLWGLRFAFAGDSDLLRWLRGSRRASAAGEPGTATQRASADHSGGPGKLGDRCSSHKPSTAGQSCSALLLTGASRPDPAAGGLCTGPSRLYARRCLPGQEVKHPAEGRDRRGLADLRRICPCPRRPVLRSTNAQAKSTPGGGTGIGGKECFQ